MTVSLKHQFTSAKSDGGDNTLVQPSNWNAEHTLTLANNTVLGRNAGTDGAAQELSGSDLRTLTGLATSDSPQFAAINLGHASDTTIARVSAGVISVEGSNVILASNNLSALSATTSAELAGVISDETGTGALVFATSPTFGTSTLHPAGSAASPSIARGTDTDTGIYWPASNALSVATGGSERVRFDGNGFVGIATTSMASMLQIGNTTTRPNPASGYLIQSYGGGNSYWLLNANTNFNSAVYFGDPSSDTVGSIAYAHNGDYMTITVDASERARINSAGELLIGTTTDNGAYLLQVNSQIYATNATIATSDARFKDNITPMEDALAVVATLRPVTFTYRQDAGKNFGTTAVQAGFIAQHLQQDLAGTLYRNSVVQECGDHLGVAYEKLIPVLTKALQEASAKISALEARIAALEA